MKRLAALLNEPDRKIKKIILELEHTSGYTSADIKLMAQMKLDVAAKVSALGLDPADTTNDELYHALQAKLQQDLATLEHAWRLGEGAPLKIAALLNSLSEGDQVLALKPASLKQILRSQPPKKTLKKLGYRSLESMLKRETAAELAGLVMVYESAAWQASLLHRISRLPMRNYEVRQIKYITCKTISDVRAVPLMASVIIGQAHASAGDVLMGLMAEQNLISEGRRLSARQFSQDFGQLAAEIFGQSLDVTNQTIFSQANLLADENRAVAKFGSLHPCLHFWSDAASLAREGERIVSLHAADVLRGLLQQAEVSTNYFRENFKQKLFNVYGNYAVGHLASESIVNETPEYDIASELELAPQQESVYN